ncbi:hypothetical protein VFPPC_06274 [Pochonia chlamydosporia 170]|uniref:Uncharacterized protein n=1 Tax=Pochonia chlamydosporia 170 TaxID=1380566 RepID=A0A179FHK4_METCM|nr:hypothetical protein VFPPC_06274 [Pochonia chlamydosporia 170]OAQ65105.1 hypothetical protein VFPPC_06274 [Pochonia chlamydosporia 170]
MGCGSSKPEVIEDTEEMIQSFVFVPHAPPPPLERSTTGAGTQRPQHPKQVTWADAPPSHQTRPSQSTTPRITKKLSIEPPHPHNNVPGSSESVSPMSAISMDPKDDPSIEPNYQSKPRKAKRDYEAFIDAREWSAEVDEREARQQLQARQKRQAQKLQARQELHPHAAS